MTSFNTTLTTTVIVALIEDGGVTLSLRGEEAPTTGYGVAVAGLGLHVEAGTPLRTAVSDFISGRSSGLMLAGRFLGAWVDEADGSTYLDVTRVIADLDTALDLARATGEIAVWDFANGVEIRA